MPFLRNRGGGKGGGGGGGPSGRGFAASPLSPGVPLDGTDTVTGLRQLARAAELDRVGTYLDAAGRNGFAPGRRYARYKGPYLEQLRAADAQRVPVAWREFFGRSLPAAAPSTGSGDGKVAGPPAAHTPWSSPASMDALRERAEENVVAFLPNYIRLAAGIILLLAVLTRPRALVGLAAMAGGAWANLTGVFGVAAAGAAAGRPGRQGGASAAATPPPPPPLKSLVNLAVYLISAYTGAPGIVFRGGLLAFAAVAGHASLLAAPSERAAAARAGRPPGVRLASVLSGKAGPLDPTPDPRRALRELGAGAAALGRAAWVGGRLAAGEAWDRAAAWARGALGIGAPPVVGASRATRAGVAPMRTVR